MLDTTYCASRTAAANVTTVYEKEVLFMFSFFSYPSHIFSFIRGVGSKDQFYLCSLNRQQWQQLISFERVGRLMVLAL